MVRVTVHLKDREDNTYLPQLIHVSEFYPDTVAEYVEEFKAQNDYDGEVIFKPFRNEFFPLTDKEFSDITNNDIEEICEMARMIDEYGEQYCKDCKYIGAVIPERMYDLKKGLK